LADRAATGGESERSSPVSAASSPGSRRFGALVVAIGLLPGCGILFDNSFLTHLATGRRIWGGDGIPYEDPYTFTAAGEPWIAQSWFASVIYGAVEKFGGLGWLRLQFGLTTAAIAGCLWLLTRPARSPVHRLVAVTPALLMVCFGLGHRPLLLGLLCLALTLLAAEGVVGHRWLVPVGWLWVNTHGSWPYGLVVLALLWWGRRLDGEDASLERRCTLWMALGFVASVASPYGPRLLWFPAVAVERREAFAGIREWKPPTFDDIGQLAFILVVVIAVVAIARRPTWRAVIPFVAFTAAALLSARNLPVAAVIAVPGTALGLAAESRVDLRLFARAAGALAVVLAVIGIATIPSTDDFGDDPYPVEANDWLVAHDLAPTQATVIAQDYVGNWWEAVYGDRAAVFMDDRMELIPIEVVRDHRTLFEGSPGWEEALGRYEPDAVVWERDLPLAELLRTSDDWEITHTDDKFVVAVPG
jgi:hypothetical protein